MDKLKGFAIFSIDLAPIILFHFHSGLRVQIVAPLLPLEQQLNETSDVPAFVFVDFVAFEDVNLRRWRLLMIDFRVAAGVRNIGQCFHYLIGPFRTSIRGLVGLIQHLGHLDVSHGRRWVIGSNCPLWPARGVDTNPNLLQSCLQKLVHNTSTSFRLPNIYFIKTDGTSLTRLSYINC